jgi:hypothetical protein
VSEDSANKRKQRKKDPIRESALRGFKYFKVLSPIIGSLSSSDAHHNRKLFLDEYIVLLLFYFFNPIVTSLRAVQRVSELKKVQRVLGVKRVSLGSLSEAGNVFDSRLIEPVMRELAEKALPMEVDARLKAVEKTLVAVDGTLLRALPDMIWALWLDDEHRAAKLHLELDIERWVPIRAEVTDANAGEKENLKRSLSSGKLYILDAGYCQYVLFEAILAKNSSFVARLRDNSVWQTIEERELTEADRLAGVTMDKVVRLGSESRQNDITGNVRVVEVYKPRSVIRDAERRGQAGRNNLIYPKGP